MSETKKPKSSLLGKLRAGIKRIVSIGKKKSEGKHPHAARPHAAKAEAPKPEKHERHSKAPEERPRREGGEGHRAAHPKERREPKREGGAGRGGRSGDRRDRGRGTRSRRGEPGDEERVSEPRVNYQAAPPPPPPPVPEGPFPEAFEALGLSPAVLAGVRDAGYTQPTQIQAQVAPIILAGRDVIGASQTGTGKTAAFGLPTLSRLGPPGKLRCLVLEPTRELAAQVVESFEKYGRHTGLRPLLVHGGVGYDKQRKGLQQGVDIVVATPGRLLDFMEEGVARLDDIEVLILDEVDRMLDMGFLPSVRRIVERIPTSRQTLFFSATMPPQIQSLADFALRDPTSIEIGIRFSPAETVSHYMYPVASTQREELLLSILDKTHFESVMIFTRTKVQADQLYAHIKQGGNYKIAVMHSDINQRDRERALKGFRDGEFEVIVATDLAARGLDISGVTHVINYMVPENPEDYVHRIGRTGRAKKEGDAFTLFSAEELPYVQSIERLINQKIERRKLEGFKYTFTTVLDDEKTALDIMRGRKKKRR